MDIFSVIKQDSINNSNSCKDFSESANKSIFRDIYFDQIFNNVHFAMALIDNNGFIQYVNSAFTELFGYKIEETAKKQIYEFISKKNTKNEIIENIKNVINGKKIMKEVILHNKEGIQINVLFLAAPIIINGQQDGANIVFTDVTIQKKNKRELEKIHDDLKETTSMLIHKERMTALGELTSSIAHELNQPLNNIKIICQDILRDIDKDRLDTATIPENMNDIVWQINKMTRIIDHMRIFTRRLDKDMNLEKMDINVPIDNMFILIGEQLRVKNIEVIKNLDDSLPQILGNTTAIEQVFTNILINARQALEDLNVNEKKIEIKSYKCNENEIAVSISNTGKKIPKEIKDRIFEPFFTTKEPGRGTGLGLSISMKIINEHNGIIELEEKNNLTTFTIKLPIIKESESNK